MSVQIKMQYKIHGMNMAQGTCHSAGNQVFYETLDEAIERAKTYVRRQGNEEDMVIYKAIVVVRKEQPPVEVLRVAEDGTCLKQFHL